MGLPLSKSSARIHGKHLQVARIDEACLPSILQRRICSQMPMVVALDLQQAFLCEHHPSLRMHGILMTR